MKKYSRLSTIDPSIIQYGSWKRRSTFGGLFFSQLNVRCFTSCKISAAERQRGRKSVCSGLRSGRGRVAVGDSVKYLLHLSGAHLSPLTLRNEGAPRFDSGATQPQPTPRNKPSGWKGGVKVAVRGGSRVGKYFICGFFQTVAATLAGRQCCIMALRSVVHSII